MIIHFLQQWRPTSATKKKKKCLLLGKDVKCCCCKVQHCLWVLEISIVTLAPVAAQCGSPGGCKPTLVMLAKKKKGFHCSWEVVQKFYLLNMASQRGGHGFDQMNEPGVLTLALVTFLQHACDLSLSIHVSKLTADDTFFPKINRRPRLRRGHTN